MAFAFRKVQVVFIGLFVWFGLAKSVISVTINREVLHWVRAKVEEGIFASRSHAVEYAVRQLMRQERRPNPGEAA